MSYVHEWPLTVFTSLFFSTVGPVAAALLRELAAAQGAAAADGAPPRAPAAVAGAVPRGVVAAHAVAALHVGGVGQAAGDENCDLYLAWTSESDPFEITNDL